MLIKRQDLTRGPISSTLLVFALPTLLSNILQSLNGSINTAWVGRFLGESALAATANANIIMFMLFSLVFGFGMAATVLVGQSFGRHHIDEARRAFGAAIGFSLLLSIVVAILGWLFSPQILTILDTPGEAYMQAESYLRIIFIAMPPTMMMVMVMMGLRGAGDSWTPLWFMIVNVVSAVVLNPILILGFGPVPAMGIAGSAWATAGGAYVSLFALIAYIYWRNLPLRLLGHEWRYILPSKSLLKVILFKGFPISLQMVVMSTAGLVMVGLVNHEGIDIVAAYNVSQQLWTYVQMPAMAVGAAVSAMVAQNIGAALWHRVWQITRAGVVITLVMIAVLLLLLLFFDTAVMTVFLGAGSPAIADARHIQLLASWSFLFFGVSMVLYATLRANGAVVVPLICLFVAMYPIRLGFYYLFYPFIGADAIWISFPVGAFASLLMAYGYYHSVKWRQVALIDPVLGEDRAAR